MRFRTLGSLKLLFGVGLLLSGLMVSQATGEGITIAPAFQELIITNSTQTETSSFSITNRSNTPQVYRLRAIDIETSNQSGGILLSGLSQEFVQKHGLLSWIKFNQSEVTLAANETKEIPFTISNPTELSPGGHYGAIVIQPTTSVAQQDSNKVSLSPEAAALIFVKKIGGEKYQLDLKSATLRTAIVTPPKSIELLFENSGDVHVVPRGSVVINDSFGNEVMRGAINTESVLILPGKYRQINVDLRSSLGGIRWPGRYSATVTYRFDGQETNQTTNISFWVLNLPLLSSIAIIIVATLWISQRYGYQIGVILRRLWKYQHKNLRLVSRTRKVMNRLRYFLTKKW